VNVYISTSDLVKYMVMQNILVQSIQNALSKSTLLQSALIAKYISTKDEIVK